MDVSVNKIASLAYLKLTELEAKAFQKQVTDILQYVEQLQSVAMTADEAKSMGAFHISMAFYKSLGLDPSQTLREETEFEDLTRLTLTNQEALKNAPQSSGLPGELLFEVPSIIER